MRENCTSVFKMHSIKRLLKYAILILVFAAVLFIRTYVVRLALVSGESMYPTLLNGDIVVINQMNYAPARSDIVLIDVSDKPIRGAYIVKRIIAVEGDTVTLDYENDSIFVNDTKISEPYLNLDQEDPMQALDAPISITYQVPIGTVFVMGDNRNYSLDSRDSVLGMISESDILGRVCRRIPITQYFY